ncbi:4-hydroxy-3-methylbut-2-enyl diphosphate reductase, putative [Plasmodium gallinaceum]|uniref:4-hydroxy-3-methylbut-2-enyl diphosphate reductase n=1 Tax=Plasmodium gallinaceum TaxID=5849 RepID=A0A1J1GLV2_PLAGA|nr:4-hydroxy-3-methylbut-2-enyl diphosphate reductase, putative [Plasmodium gallinaceum]CRG93299.1 4-hydroxy-3-methylbut-2-enyl diphosphate reductase, putative [Plasmodium gallinaceum]
MYYVLFYLFKKFSPHYIPCSKYSLKFFHIFFFKCLIILLNANIIKYTMKNPLKLLETPSKIPMAIWKVRNIGTFKTYKKNDVKLLNYTFLYYNLKFNNSRTFQNAGFFSERKLSSNSKFSEETNVKVMCKKIDGQETNSIINENNNMDKGLENISSDEKILYLVNPRGFCKGVSRAIETVEECLKLFNTQIYVKHKIVHNDIVCRDLEKKGAIFIEDLNEVPDGSILIYSAHGISPQIRELAKKKKLFEIDATCPLVNKVHVYVQVKAKEGYKIILIGHKNHVEVIGTYNEAPECTFIVENVKDVENLNFPKDEKLFYVTQTTLSMDDCALIVKKLKEKYPQILTIPSGSICYATTNRQQALNQICTECDLTIVVGSQSSSNAKKLVYSSQIRNVPSLLVNTVDEFNFDILKNVKKIALTSAASTPEEETQKFVQVLTAPPFIYKLKIFDGVKENVPKWKLPKNLLDFIKGKKQNETN